MRTLSVILAAAAVLLIGAGCSSDKTGQSTGPQDWKKQAPPASYVEQAKGHGAPAPPSGGAPPNTGQPASTP